MICNAENFTVTTEWEIQVESIVEEIEESTQTSPNSSIIGIVDNHCW
jgi:hypothetical protein